MCVNTPNISLHMSWTLSFNHIWSDFLLRLDVLWTHLQKHGTDFNHCFVDTIHIFLCLFAYQSSPLFYLKSQSTHWDFYTIFPQLNNLGNFICDLYKNMLCTHNISLIFGKVVPHLDSRAQNWIIYDWS